MHKMTWWGKLFLKRVFHNSTPRQMFSFLFLQESFKGQKTFIVSSGTYELQVYLHLSHTLSLTHTHGTLTVPRCHGMSFFVLQLGYFGFSHLLTQRHTHVHTHTHTLRAGCGTWGYGAPGWWRGVRRSWPRRRARGRPTTTRPRTRCPRAPRRSTPRCPAAAPDPWSTHTHRDIVDMEYLSAFLVALQTSDPNWLVE